MPEDMVDLLVDWRLSLVARNRSEQTIKDYLCTGEAFARDVKGDPTGVTRRQIERWLSSLDVKPATRAKHYRNLQQLFRFLVMEEIIDRSPFERMQAPHVPEAPVPVLTEVELRRLFAAAGGSSFEDRRDLAIMRLLADTGMRCSELVGINADDVDFKTLSVPVLGKGRRVRVSVFGARTAQALRRYLRARKGHPEVALWIGRKGPISDSGIRQMLERRGEQAGVPNLHPHRFRHTFAHRWLSGGGTEGDLMRLAGWSSRQMLDRYGRSAADERARDAHKRMGLGDAY